jgi:hypothetical protein
MASSRGPDNSVRIAISGTQNSINWANVFHAQLTTSSSIAQSDLDTWTTAVANAYKTRFAPQQTATVVYSLAKAVCFTPGGGELVSSSAMTGAGTSGGTQVSDQSACFVVSWTTNVYWRGGKPRTYLPGPANALVTNSSTIAAGTITSLGTAATNFRSDVNALTSGTITGTSFGFVSFSTGNAPRTPPLFFAIVGAKIHPRLGTQRRRLGRWTN